MVFFKMSPWATYWPETSEVDQRSMFTDATIRYKDRVSVDGARGHIEQMHLDMGIVPPAFPLCKHIARKAVKMFQREYPDGKQKKGALSPANAAVHVRQMEAWRDELWAAGKHREAANQHERILAFTAIFNAGQRSGNFLVNEEGLLGGELQRGEVFAFLPAAGLRVAIDPRLACGAEQGGGSCDAAPVEVQGRIGGVGGRSAEHNEGNAGLPGGSALLWNTRVLCFSILPEAWIRRGSDSSRRSIIGHSFLLGCAGYPRTPRSGSAALTCPEPFLFIKRTGQKVRGHRIWFQEKHWYAFVQIIRLFATDFDHSWQEARNHGKTKPSPNLTRNRSKRVS